MTCEVVYHFFWQFSTTLDICLAQVQERVNFPFSSELFCLFFQRFLETRPTFFWQPCRTMMHVWMKMWGQMIPKRGLSDYPTRISTNALEFLASVDDHSFVMVSCPYIGLDW